MSVVERLEKSLEFLKSHTWGQYADRQKCEDSPDGYSYCAQGAVAFGAFPDRGDEEWCEQQVRFHIGPCKEDEYGECSQRTAGPVHTEFQAVIKLLDDTTVGLDGMFSMGVTWYNDYLYRTKEDIIALFEKAITKAKGAE